MIKTLLKHVYLGSYSFLRSLSCSDITEEHKLKKRYLNHGIICCSHALSVQTHVAMRHSKRITFLKLLSSENQG
jgi:hypothetical protein